MGGNGRLKLNWDMNGIGGNRKTSNSYLEEVSTSLYLVECKRRVLFQSNRN